MAPDESDGFRMPWMRVEQRGEQSGCGRYTYANQAVYDGVWENGRKHGSGYFSSSGQLLLELWCRGVRVKRCEVRDGGVTRGGGTGGQRRKRGRRNCGSQAMRF